MFAVVTQTAIALRMTATLPRFTDAQLKVMIEAFC
jgi:hypothetical protein